MLSKLAQKLNKSITSSRPNSPNNSPLGKYVVYVRGADAVLCVIGVIIGMIWSIAQTKIAIMLPIMHVVIISLLKL